MFAHKDVEIVEKVLNSDINQISRYCTENELLLNLKKGKTEVMLMGTAQRLHRHGRELNISYNDQPINVVEEYVYLGNVIDNHMTLTPNFDRAFKIQRSPSVTTAYSGISYCKFGGNYLQLDDSTYSNL